MAKTLAVLISLTVSFFFIHFPQNSHAFHRNISPKELGLDMKREKLSHFHFYFHDSLKAKNPNSIIVAEAPTTKASRTEFGKVVVMDDDLTVGPEKDSKRVGKAQGIFASASKSDLEYLMVLNMVFSEGKYNGSALSVLGHNAVFSGTREMPIVGGSGFFRFARGFAQAKTYSFDIKNFVAVVEYNVYVFHY